jgi:hypothetical protein
VTNILLENPNPNMKRLSGKDCPKKPNSKEVNGKVCQNKFKLEDFVVHKKLGKI